MLKSSIFHCFLYLFLFFISNSQAREPLPARFSADAYTGVYTVGQADLMVSLDGDRQHNLYINPQGAYGSDQQWYGDVGLGYRWIKNDAAILGWYLFAGHTRVENNSGFWITNPGLEIMGSRWDARVNAYIPVAGRSHELGIKTDIVSTPVFTGHTEVINSVFNLANETQQLGNGADARVGYQLIRHVPLKAYVGAYFFAMPNSNNMSGGAAGAEYWFDRNVKAFVNYSYDNYQHSKVVGGLGISFGGVRQEWADPTLSERLTDPVERYLANLGHGSPIPSKTNLYGMGSGSSTELISDSIAFFREQGGNPNNGGAGLTLANCTFESPCGPTDFSQTGVNTLGTILPNTNLYFNGGTYTGGGTVTLVPGQSVQSRTADYSQPATGAARSTIINNGINLQGNNTLENIILLPLVSGGTGVNIIDSNNVITGSQIGSSSDRPGIGVSLVGISTRNTIIDHTDIFSSDQGVSFSGNENMTIQDSRINVINQNAGDVIGVYSNADVEFSLNNVRIEGTGSAFVEGIVVASSGTRANVTNTTISLTGVPTGTATGLVTFANGEIYFTGGSISVGAPTTFIADNSGAGGPISLAGTVCQVNGNTVMCP